MKDRQEHGAALILVAAALLLLVGIVAIVIDLAAVRLDIRADRLASDAAATAGVMSIDPFAGSGVEDGCEAAWGYLLLNLDDVDDSLPAPPGCSTAFAGPCDPSVARVVTASAGPYTFEIVHPVPDADDLMGDQGVVASIDGVACQRLGVTVSRTRQHLFARVLGFDSSATTVSSVARLDPDAGGGEVVPLLVLEPVDCAAVYTSGQGKVTVSYDTPTATPGFIVVDSDASTCGSPNPYSIDSLGNQNGWIRAIPEPVNDIPSAILSYALADRPPADPARAYDPGDLTDSVDPADAEAGDPPESLFRLYPQPIAVSRRITRAPIDWRYNCKDGYDSYPIDLSDASAGGIPIADCPSSPAPHIDLHVQSYGQNMPSWPGPANNWITEGHPCTVSADLSVSGDWFIDCPGGLVVNGATLIFDDSNVVLTGGIDLRSTAVLAFNQGSDEDHFIFVRNEGGNGTILKNAQSTLVIERTFVYLADGAVDLRGGDGGLTWTAPESGNFEDLALWSEGRVAHDIGGQAGNTLTGTFFTPYAEPFSLTGQGGQFQTEAQFITRRLEVKGQGEVKMTPDPDHSTLIPIRAVRLIR